MQEEKSPLTEWVAQSRAASRVLSKTPSDVKNRVLNAMAASLLDSASTILASNAQDVAAAESAQKGSAFVDRLRLTQPRIEKMAKALREVAALEDPIGQVVSSWRRPNGLTVQKVRLPLGVVMMVYESRPDVTSDAAGLCLKSGNAVILRGGSESLASNRAIEKALHQALASEKLPEAAVALVPTTEREAMLQLLKMEGQIDLCIPRGGEGLIRFVAEHARIPVVKHYKGVCHVYVHASADLKMAQDIVMNGKVQRPGVCNALECLLVDREVAEAFLPQVGKALAAAKVEIRACPTSITLFKRAGVDAVSAAPDDYGKEFLDLILAVRVVKDLDHALEHISQYGSEHTEAIVTNSLDASSRFCREVTASAVMVNASTRFNDGGELGLGAEIGISTSRLHAFGPMGLSELTAQKYVVVGEGQVR